MTDGSGAGSLPSAGFVISDVEPSRSATRETGGNGIGSSSVAGF
jgi:hypothetical protein